MKKKHAILYVIFIIFLMFGAFLYLDPYLLTTNETITSLDTWYNGNTQQAYFYFKLSSPAFITTNYPVTIQVKVIVLNPELVPIINSEKYQAVSIVGTENYPITYGSQTGLISTGTISLTFDGNRTYEGEGIVIFPYTGSNYDYTFYTLTSLNNLQLIYGENKTSPTSSAIPPFSIEEGYSTRASFEQTNRNNGTSFFAIGIAGIALVAYIQFETEKGRVNDFTEIEKQLKKLNVTLDRLNNYLFKKQNDENKQKANT
jgi:hypothetical protein